MTNEKTTDTCKIRTGSRANEMTIKRAKQTTIKQGSCNLLDRSTRDVDRDLDFDPGPPPPESLRLPSELPARPRQVAPRAKSLPTGGAALAGGSPRRADILAARRRPPEVGRPSAPEPLPPGGAPGLASGRRPPAGAQGLQRRAESVVAPLD